MPQIDHDNLSFAVRILKKSGIGVSLKSILPTELHHSQHEINDTKVQNIIKDIQSGKPMPPIVASSDNYIVDGHHRQVAYETMAPNKPIKIIQIDLPQKLAVVVWKKIESKL